jgi:hypothetical protein
MHRGRGRGGDISAGADGAIVGGEVADGGGGTWGAAMGEAGPGAPRRGRRELGAATGAAPGAWAVAATARSMRMEACVKAARRRIDPPPYGKHFPTSNYN